jgi:hypothetical protein
MKSACKGFAFVVFFLGAWVTAFAQSQDGSSRKPADTPGVAKTIVGCITGYEGRYTLGTSSDTLYLLDGDPALLKRYNAVLVRVTGTISEPPPGASKNSVLSQQPPTLTVSKLKKVADGCN